MLSNAPLPELTREETLRYSRHLLLPEVTIEGQKRLKAARVLQVGAGGLGSPIALYLAAAGIEDVPGGVKWKDIAAVADREIEIPDPIFESIRKKLLEMDEAGEIAAHHVSLYEKIVQPGE